ncbi:transcriptional regulatory protein pro-1 [Fusarium austroafricanum]|uniref:Transcriptional regulatory protein pro-1 n=1 Tax=Fusarium austroafricanum TaxID=2364996 RepID=A0A8H4KBS7_9HYPO|nr:transcriptional regulatory protein pro-1 [Fusarium austroafricanum]
MILYVSTVSMYHHGKTDDQSVIHRRTQALVLLRNATDLLKPQKESHEQECREQHQSLSVLSPREVTLAAHLMHIVTEVMMGNQETEAHLQAAFCLITELGFVDRLPQGFYSRFLVQRFAMIDVVLSFLRRRKPLAPLNFALYQLDDEADEKEPHFRELTGCYQTVLSFLARISVLANSPGLSDPRQVAEAYQLESEMRFWGALRYPDPCLSHEPVISLNMGQDQSTETEDIRKRQLDTLSECFYWVAHLLLARRVFFDPTTSHRVQLYRRYLFTLMERLPAGCGPDSSLPFPFYMAAREAISSHDRDWVRKKHDDMLRKYPDHSRELMMRLTEEIWKKNDADMVAMVQNPLMPVCWVNDDIYIGFLDSQASHFLF